MAPPIPWEPLDIHGQRIRFSTIPPVLAVPGMLECRTGLSFHTPQLQHHGKRVLVWYCSRSGVTRSLEVSDPNTFKSLLLMRQSLTMTKDKLLYLGHMRMPRNVVAIPSAGDSVIPSYR